MLRVSQKVKQNMLKDNTTEYHVGGATKGAGDDKDIMLKSRDQEIAFGDVDEAEDHGDKGGNKFKTIDDVNAEFNTAKEHDVKMMIDNN